MSSLSHNDLLSANVPTVSSCSQKIGEALLILYVAIDRSGVADGFDSAKLISEVSFIQGQS